MFGQRTSRSAPPLIEQRNLQLPDQLITYTLKRSHKRRSIGLRIDERGLTVSLPLRATETWLESVLQEKSAWVADKLANWQTRKTAPQSWQDGASLIFRGEEFVLRVVPSVRTQPPQLSANELLVYLVRPDAADRGAAQIEKLVSHWYRRQAQQVFEECVAYFVPMMKVAPQQIKLSNAQTQWGSCTAQGVVRLNWRLVKMPLHLIDYVVAHELAHLLEMNHSARFWQVVETVCPDYRQCRAELRSYGIAE